MGAPPEVGPAGRPSRVRFRILAWLCSLSTITYIDRVCIMQVQSDMQRDLGLGAGQFAWAFSAFALAYSLFEIPTGWLGDRVGPRKVLIRIVLCWLLFTALTGLVWEIVGLIVVRFLFGACEAGAYPTMARAARNWFPFAERGRAQGLVWAFGRAGGAVAPILIMGLAYLVALAGLPGWRGGFVLLGLVGAVWVAGFARSFRNTPGEHPAVNDAERRLIHEGPEQAVAPAPLSWATVVSSPTLWLLSGMYFCGNCGWSFFITYVTPYLRHDLGWDGWQLHAASGLPLLCGAVGCLLGGVVTDRQVRFWGRRWGRTLQGVVACAAAGGFFLLAMWLTKSSPGLAFAALCLASFAKDLAMAASWATTIDIGHAYSGTVAGVMNSIGNLGTVVSAPLVAWLATVAGSTAGPDWRTSLYFYASMFFAAAVCWLFINPRRVIVYAAADRTPGSGGGCRMG